jgi:O-antigen ligase
MSRRLEIGALLALCFFLPLYEAPKNILWALYAVIWIVNRVRARAFGGRWDAWDSLIAAWIASGFVVAAFAGAPGGDEWRGAIDLLRYGSVLWLAKRSRYEAREVRWVVGVLVLSTVVGLGQAFAAIFKGQEGALQLNSVGHVNHTAIYLAIVLGVCVSWLLARWRNWSWPARVGALAVGLCVFGSLMYTASRGAIGVGIALPLVLAAAWRSRWRGALPATVLVVAAVVVAGFAVRAEVFLKQEELIEARNIFSNRIAIWHAAVHAWQRYPWAGVGVDNFQLITEERLREWRKEAGEPFDAGTYAFFRHGHSLYFNALAERGIVGFLPLMALLAALLLSLIRQRPRAADDDESWLVWGSAVSAWSVTCGVGLVNTTLHHEHGILAALLLGLWLSKRPAR